MNRQLLALLGVLLLGAAIVRAGGQAEAHGSVDQSFLGPFTYGPCTNFGGGGGFYTHGTTVGQTFTTGPTVTSLMAFDLWFAFGSGAGATFKITDWPDTDSVLGTSGPASPDGGGFEHFDLASPITVAPSTQYAIINANNTELCFQADCPSGGICSGATYAGGGMVSALYPGGVFGGYYEDTSFDARFQTYSCPGSCGSLDGDGDGIADPVDVEPANAANETFSDIPLTGTTAGTVLARNGHTLTMTDATPNPAKGVTAVVGGSNVNRLRIRLDGKSSTVRLTNGTYVLTDPVHTTSVEVTDGGEAEIEVILDGLTILIVVSDGGSLTYTETLTDEGDVAELAIDAVGGDVTLNGVPILAPIADVAPPANPLQCKNGGWAEFYVPFVFQSQAECISWLAQHVAPYDKDYDGVCNRGAASPVCDGTERCADTPLSERPVDTNGCSQSQVDRDKDGVCDRGVVSPGPNSRCSGYDRCAGTPTGERPVDANGCSQSQVDKDKDGVCDRGVVSPGPDSRCSGYDRCPDTPTGERPVDANGCSVSQVDSNGDGICNRGVQSPLCASARARPSGPESEAVTAIAYGVDSVVAPRDTARAG